MNTLLSLVVAGRPGLLASRRKWLALIAGAIGSVPVSIAFLCIAQPAAAQFIQSRDRH